MQRPNNRPGQNGGALCPGRVLVVAHFLPKSVKLARHGDDSGASDDEPFEVATMAGGSGSQRNNNNNDGSGGSNNAGVESNVPSNADWTIEPAENGNAGLYNAMDSVRHLVDVVYIGQPGCVVPEPLRDDVAEGLKRHGCVPVFVNEDESVGHYMNFCKKTLWPLFHYCSPEFDRDISEGAAWKHYWQVNRKAAEVVIDTYMPGDIVWIHDYHLMLVPQMVRQKLATAMIGFFLHIPFPTSELFRCLHVRREVMSGILGADLVGFQTYSFARHFIQTCSRILGHETTPNTVHLPNTVVTIGTFPIGIDFENLMQKKDSDEVKAYVQAMRERYADKKVLMGRDKLDYIKGVPHKLLAFEKFLKSYPEWRGKVILIQVTTVTNDQKQLEMQVNDLVNRINGKYGSLEYTPVVYLHQNIPTSQYMALLTVADACLITSLRDGMNLTSHEYVGCQKDNYSPLILSEFAGTYGSFAGAIRVNPWDYKEVSSSIHEALTMQLEEKKLKHAELFGYISSNTAQFWATSFLNEIQKVATHNLRRFSDNIHANLLTILRDYNDSQRRVLIFGYEGVLAEFNRTVLDDVDTQAPSDHLRGVLQRLSNDPCNLRVATLSSRPRTILEEWFQGLDRVILGAESGCFIKIHSDGWLCSVTSMDFSWRDEVTEVFEYYTERTEGSLIERGDMMLTWQYRGTDQRFGDWQSKECYAHIESVVGTYYPVHITLGRRNIEVVPWPASKGFLVKMLLSHCGVLPPNTLTRRPSTALLGGNSAGAASSPPSSFLSNSPSLTSYMNHAAAGNHATVALNLAPDFVLCIGADKCDESMYEFISGLTFPQLNNDDVIKHVCSVSLRPSGAASSLHSTYEVLLLLTALSFLEETRSPEAALAQAQLLLAPPKQTRKTSEPSVLVSKTHENLLAAADDDFFGD